MPKLMTAEEWLNKAFYEGGLFEGMVDYGMTEADLDPNDDPELYADVKKVHEALKSVAKEISRINTKGSNIY